MTIPTPDERAALQATNSQYPYTTEIDSVDGNLNHRVTVKDGTTVDLTTQSNRVTETDPARFAMVSESLGSDNLTVATHYLPSSDGVSMLGFKSLSVSGVMTTSGTVSTLTLEVRNQDSGSWVTLADGYDSAAAAAAASITDATGLFAWNFDELNKGYFRLKLVIDNATNTNEIDIHRTPL